MKANKREISWSMVEKLLNVTECNRFFSYREVCVLIGSPSVGKSTLIVICLCWIVVHWHQWKETRMNENKQVRDVLEYGGMVLKCNRMQSIFRRGVCVLVGKPTLGKSTLIVWLALHWLTHNWREKWMNEWKQTVRYILEYDGTVLECYRMQKNFRKRVCLKIGSPNFGKSTLIVIALCLTLAKMERGKAKNEWNQTEGAIS